MSNTSPLPFELTGDSVATWLESISLLSTVNAASKLNKVINQLRKIECDQQLIFPILLKLTPTTLHLSNTLSSTVSHTPNKKNKDIAIKIAKLSMQLFRNLSLAFHSLIDAETLAMEQKQQAVYYALQIIGQYLRISSVFNEMPSETLWSKSGELYSFTTANNCLRQNITVKIPEFKSQSSIEAVLKRNLLFTISASHKLSNADSQAIYSFANQYFHLLELKTDQKKTSLFYWSFKSGIPCQTTQPSQPFNDNDIAIDTTALEELIQSSSFTSNISDSELRRLFRQLSGYKKLIIDSIPSAPVIFNMLSGYPAICDFLNEREKLIRIHKLSAEIAEDRKAEYDMSLEPLVYEKNFFSDSASALNKKTSFATIKMGQPVKCLKTSKENFLIAECKNSDHLNGEPVILINNNNVVIPGIIRQQKSVESLNTTQFLIEKFQGRLAVYNINSDKENSKTVIVINEATDRPEILLATERYHNGSAIAFNNKTARLDSLVEYSPFFVRYQVSFD